MAIFFSATTCSFYDSLISSSMPADALEITASDHAALLQGQQAGQVISADANNLPVLVDPQADSSPERRTLEIATKRFQAEIAGITLNGSPVPTDRDSQALVTGAAVAAMLDSTYHCQWKTSTGFVDLDAAAILKLASAMRAHVQACFDREAELLAALDDGSLTSEMLDEGWPA